MSENKLMPAAASSEVYWRDPVVEAPPRGVKMLVLTSGAVAVISDWTDDSNFVAWSPLPKRPIRVPVERAVDWPQLLTEEPDHGE
jgi:hypothetical protein